MLKCFNAFVSLCAFEQIRTKNARRPPVGLTEARHPSPRAAHAVSRGTPLFLSANSTTLGDLMHWSRGWAATASAGRHTGTHIMVTQTCRMIRITQVFIVLLRPSYLTGIRMVMKAHGVTPTRTCSWPGSCVTFLDAVSCFIIMDWSIEVTLWLCAIRLLTPPVSFFSEGPGHHHHFGPTCSNHQQQR